CARKGLLDYFDYW
nr:immunoglobulin heavy chain junction region [Mus musculus]